MKKEKLYDVVCSKFDAVGNSETYNRTVGTKLTLKEAQQAMLDDALTEVEYNGFIYVGRDGESSSIPTTTSSNRMSTII